MADYTELVKALRTCKMSIPCAECPFYSNGDEPSKECATMNVAAADAIEELLVKAGLWHRRYQLEHEKVEKLRSAVPHWISVEERLPEPYQNVLTCAWKLFGVDRKRICGIDYVLDNGEWACGGESYKTMVTHWMPLPEPPKEVER